MSCRNGAEEKVTKAQREKRALKKAKEEDDTE